MQTLFITGHRKSGTTMLASLFDGHKDLSVYPTDLSLMYAYYPNFNINTIILGGIYQEEFDKGFVEKYSENTPIKRMMDIDEITSGFEFLLNEDSTYITGTELKIDGGWTAW